MATNYLITNIRLSPYIEVRAQKATEPFSWNLDAQTYPTVPLNIENTKLLGYVQEVTIDSDRENKTIYVLGKEINVRPFEVYPTQTSYSISLNNLVLYEHDILKDFFFEDNLHYGVYSQSIPLHFLFTLYKPQISSTSNATPELVAQEAIKAQGCWLKKFPLTFKSEGELSIVQTIELTATLIQYQKISQ